MTDVNEEIVRTYFELKGYIVSSTLKYTIHKISSGESDIDLAVYNLKTGEQAIVEVKGWHTENFTKSFFEEDDPERYANRIFHFVRKEALEKAEEFFKSDNFKKILVVSKLGPKQREECLEITRSRGVDEVLEFDEILKFVIEKVEPNKNYPDSMFLHTVRLLKYYKFLIPDDTS